jgi:hypothetical protein
MEPKRFIPISRTTYHHTLWSPRGSFPYPELHATIPYGAREVHSHIQNYTPPYPMESERFIPISRTTRPGNLTYILILFFIQDVLFNFTLPLVTSLYVIFFFRVVQLKFCMYSHPLHIMWPVHLVPLNSFFINSFLWTKIVWVVTLKSIFWDILSYSLVNINWHSEGT